MFIIVHNITKGSDVYKYICFNLNVCQVGTLIETFFRIVNSFQSPGNNTLVLRPDQETKQETSLSTKCRLNCQQILKTQYPSRPE